MVPRRCGLALGLCCLALGVARAEEEPLSARSPLAWPPRLALLDLPPGPDPRPAPPTAGRRGAGVLEGEAPAQSAIDADRRQRQVPRFRLELSGRALSLIDARFKLGPKGPRTHTVRVHRETHLPRVPHLGYRVLFDAQVHRDWLVGATFAQLLVRGSRRNIHRDGLAVGGQVVDRDAHGDASIDLSVGTFFVRYVILDNDRIRLSWGTGALFARFRFRFDGGPGERLDDQADVWFGPTLDYLIQFRLFGEVHLYLESVFAVLAPARLGAYVSEFRFGLRYGLGGGLELLLALNSFSGSLDEYRDLWGGRRTGGHRFERASWTSLGGEVGLSWRF